MSAALELVPEPGPRRRAPATLRRRVPRLALSRAEAAEALGISASHFDRHVRDHVPCVYVGDVRLFPLSGLQAWLDDQAIKPGRRPS